MVWGVISNKTPEPKINQPIPIQVKYTQKSTLKPFLPGKKSRASKGLASKKASKKSKQLTSYHQLLPKQFDLPQSSSQSTQMSSPQAYSQNAVDSHIIGSHFELPIALRNIKAKGNASLRVSKTGSKLKIEYLVGLPTLRAIIYESIKNPPTYKALSQILKNNPSPYLFIQVKFFQKNTEDPSQPSIVDKVTTPSFSHVIIEKTFYRRSTQSSGFFLPDEHAEKAQKRDFYKLKYLKLSKAYKKVIRNEIIEMSSDK